MCEARLIRLRDPAGVAGGRRGIAGGAAGGGALWGTGRWRADGPEDGFISTHQFIIDVAEGACCAVQGRHQPPGTLVPLLCRCHRDHLFVIRDGLLVRPYVRNRAPLRSANVRPVEY